MTINYDNVAAACNELLIDGQTPTIRSVRAKLGKGSESTIQPLLKQWKLNSSKNIVEDQLELPTQILRDISAWARANSSKVCAELALKLANSEQDEAELTQAATRLEECVTDLQHQLADAKSARDASEAVAGERKSEVERLAAEAGQERSLRVAATVKAVEYQARLEAQTNELENLRAEQGQVEGLRAAKIAAEKAAAVSLANGIALQANAEERAAALTECRQELLNVRDSIEKLRTYHASQLQFERETINRMYSENKIIAAQKFKTHQINYTFKPT